jgi:FkbM family methyltransferase
MTSTDVPRPSRVFQAAFDRLLTLPVGSTSRMLLFRALRRLYRSFAKGRNLLVRYSVDGREIYFPALHDAPFNWKFVPDNSKSLGRVALACAGKYPESVIVDVGANVGDSAAIIRSYGVSNRIISVEGVAEFYEVLVRNAELLGDVTPVLAFVAASEHRAAANLRVLPGGNAVVCEDPAAFGIPSGSMPTIDCKFLTLDQVVEQHAAGASVKLLKTDIEGYDLPVLNGSLAFIARHRPVVYLELHVSEQDERVRGVSWQDLWSNLRALGYAKALYWYNSDDFLCMLDLERDDHVIGDIHDYFRNRAGRLYLDVCLIHGEDADLAQTVCAGEKSHARALRG